MHLHSTGRISLLLHTEIDQLSRSAEAARHRAEVLRLQQTLARLRDLEASAERILAAVIADKATETRDPLAIPEFLRRY